MTGAIVSGLAIPAGAPSGPAVSRLKLTIAYDGMGFAGSQRQAGQRTVQAELEAAHGQLAGRPGPVTLAGRTDAGVHAAGQVGSVTDLVPHLETDTIRRAFAGLLPDDVSVWRVERVPPEFHARFDARWREYRYRIWEGEPSPSQRRQSWQRRWELDVEMMGLAAARLVGERDFSPFANVTSPDANGGEGRSPGSPIRTIHACRVHRVPGPWDVRAGAGTMIEIQVIANGFLRRMVRTIVGVLVEVGRGRHGVSWVERILADRAERNATRVAPAHGLVLWRVGYDDDEWRYEGRA
ncbi:MAG: tRNA pseudouridine(38-40) synthase TruA [Chloroflexia bacterium]|nr:tRNA pseudouridine(38-40) synthase TruA [Chloroflexia bacterium]